ncbi:MAG: hypothetical protein GF398_12490 [Chitinivibrionales bacterium]|nr:hypothetical protein [Chitinivibrionales bacterium]
MMRKYSAVLVCASVWWNMHADISVTPDSRSSLEIAIAGDQATFYDVRKIEMPQGVHIVRFENVAATINKHSVYLELPNNPSLVLMEQNFEYDLVSSQKLLEKYIGKELEIVPAEYDWPDSSVQSAELLSIHGGQPVFRMGAKITFGDIGQILFPYMPENLYTSPTMIWRINSAKRQPAEFAVTYVADSLSWDVEYHLQLEKGKEVARFSGWLTVHNRTGLDISNARIGFCLPHEIGSDQQASQSNADKAHPQLARLRKTFKRKNARQPLLKIADKSNVSLANHQTKKLFWFADVPANLTSRYQVGFDRDEAARSRISKTAECIAEISNSRKARLGFALPAGMVAVYEKNRLHPNLFLGSGEFDGAQKDRKIHFPVPANSQVIVQKRNFPASQTNELKELKQKFLLSNAGKNDIILSIESYVGKNTTLAHSSHKYEALDDSTISWNVLVRSESQNELECTLRRPK